MQPRTRTTRLSSLPELATTISGAYGAALLEHPLATKSLTAGALCGVGDALAQSRNSGNEKNTNENETTKSYDLLRTLRFAAKGCLGGILWSFWYDQIDGFLRFREDFEVGGTSVVVVDGEPSRSLSLYALTGAVFPVGANASFLAFAKAHLAAVTTVISILMEQFLWCPLVYGTFEIPIATLLNGGDVASIQGEVKGKLNGLLVSNAKVWTLANLLIYNAPLEWRLLIGNCIDIFWQSIVADVAADCGGPGQEECEVDDDETEGLLVLAASNERPANATTGNN